MQPKTMRMQDELWTNYLCRRMKEQGLGKTGFDYQGTEEGSRRLFSNVSELGSGLCYIVDLETQEYDKMRLDPIPTYSSVPIKEEILRVDLSTVAGLAIPIDRIDVTFYREGNIGLNPNEPYVKALFEKDTAQRRVAAADEIIDALIMYALNPFSLVQDLNRSYQKQLQQNQQPQRQSPLRGYIPGPSLILEPRLLQLQIKPKKDKQ